MNFGMMNPNINVGMPNVFNNNGNNFVNNNMLNQFNNNNQFIINQMNLKKKLFKESFNETDPFKIQLKIALGLNNNMPYENCVAGGNKGFSFHLGPFVFKPPQFYFVILPQRSLHFNSVGQFTTTPGPNTTEFPIF